MSSTKSFDVDKLSTDYRWIHPDAALPFTDDDVLSVDQVKQWRDEGYLLLNGVLPDAVWQTAGDELEAAQPKPVDVADGQKLSEKVDFENAISSFFSQLEFGAQFTFPRGGDTPLNAIPFHPRMVKCVMQLFGDSNTNDIRLIQSEPWAKYGASTIVNAAANQDQRIHCDFGNNTLAHPPSWHNPEVVAGILYYSDVDECLGATAVVAREGEDDWALTYNGGHGGLPFFNNREDMEEEMEKNHPEVFNFRQRLYPREKVVNYRPGTLLIYRQDIWHRGTPLRPGTVRYVHNLAYKQAHAEWVTSWHEGYAKYMYHDSSLVMEPWFAKLSASQRNLLGFPHPGHPYWTSTTLRYNTNRWQPWGMDMAEYQLKKVLY